MAAHSAALAARDTRISRAALVALADHPGEIHLVWLQDYWLACIAQLDCLLARVYASVKILRV